MDVALCCFMLFMQTKMLTGIITLTLASQAANADTVRLELETPATGKSVVSMPISVLNLNNAGDSTSLFTLTSNNRTMDLTVTFAKPSSENLAAMKLSVRVTTVLPNNITTLIERFEAPISIPRTGVTGWSWSTPNGTMRVTPSIIAK